MFKITIPKPCHEDWAQMTTADQGRHCNVCAKTVTDFTSMTDEEVQNYLINKNAERICGRFTSAQLRRVRVDIPQKIFYISMPLWKRFLVASLLVFGSTLFSCDAGIEHTTKGQITAVKTGAVVNVPSADTNIKVLQQMIDTPKCTAFVGKIKTVSNVAEMGEVVMVPDSIKPPPPPIHLKMGIIAQVPVKKVKHDPKSKRVINNAGKSEK